MSKFICAIATLSGTIIGVGIFSLPYVASKVGFWTMAGYFLILGAVVILVHLFYGELALKTPDFKRLPGFAKFHLGNWGRNLAFVSTILGFLGAILSYLIVGGEFLKNLLSPIFGGGNVLYTILYFSIGAGLIYFGIKAISKIEFWGLILFFIILIVIFFRAQPHWEMANLFPRSDFSSIFLPYGVVLFSLWGASLIPEIEEMLGERKDLLLKIVFIAVLVPIIVYLFFVYLILGITGPQTTESALTGLRNVLDDRMVSLALFFGLLATFTSFITLGLTLRKTLWYDLKIEKNLAWVITCFLPLILFLAGVKRFIPVISFVGGVMIGIDGILILLMYRKIKPGRKFLIYPLLLIFLGGIIYEITYFVR